MKKRITLVVPPFKNDEVSFISPPLNILRAASYLDRRDYEIIVIDFPLMIRRRNVRLDDTLHHECARSILREKPDLIAFTTLCINFPTTINIVRQVRKMAADVPIVLGGPQATLSARETLHVCPEVDYILRGEAEIPFKLLVEALLSGKEREAIGKIPGICYRRPGGSDFQVGLPYRFPDFARVPLPDYALLNIEQYRKNSHALTFLIESGRGCSYNCIFCSSCLMPKKPRVRPVESVVEEMRFLSDRYDAGEFSLFDLFVYSEREIMDFCSKVGSGGRKLKWFTRARIDGLSKDLIECMAAAGCFKILVTPESGLADRDRTFKRTLPLKHKETELITGYSAAKGITTTIYYPIGFAEDDEATLDAVMQAYLNCSIRYGAFPVIQLLGILPGKTVAAGNESFYPEITTIFSSGINFSGGTKLPDDDQLIRNNFQLFSSFYSVKTNFAVNYALYKHFSGVGTHFGKTFYLLKKQLKLNNYRCFFHFFDGYESSAPPVEFLDYFIGRIESDFSGSKPLLNMLTYEKTAYHIEQGRIPADPGCLRLSENVYVRQFDYPVHTLIQAIREDAPASLESLSEDRAYYLFRRENDFLKISKVNAFVYAYLREYINSKSLSSLAQKLTAHFPVKDPVEMQKKCIDAYQAFLKQGIITPFTGTDEKERALIS